MLDAEHRAPEWQPVAAAEVRVSPALEVLGWYPEFLADEYGYNEWVRAETATEAAAALKDLWGEGRESSRDWALLTAELDMVWMRQEAMDPANPNFGYSQIEQGTPHPITWKEVTEETPGATLYWRYGS